MGPGTWGLFYIRGWVKVSLAEVTGLGWEALRESTHPSTQSASHRGLEQEDGRGRPERRSIFVSHFVEHLGSAPAEKGGHQKALSSTGGRATSPVKVTVET